jgi:hypothetical protein
VNLLTPMAVQQALDRLARELSSQYKVGVRSSRVAHSAHKIRSKRTAAGHHDAGHAGARNGNIEVKRIVFLAAALVAAVSTTPRRKGLSAPASTSSR